MVVVALTCLDGNLLVVGLGVAHFLVAVDLNSAVLVVEILVANMGFVPRGSQMVVVRPGCIQESAINAVQNRVKVVGAAELEVEVLALEVEVLALEV